MLVIIASRHDAAAPALAERWSAHNAALLTCEDLSVAGWCHHLNAAGVSTAVISGRVVATTEITGVLTRLPCVTESELAHIVPADRAYVAAEMTAFLTFWLSELVCPVLNRPTPVCLMGPNWRTERWIHAAAQLGIPVCPSYRQATLTADVSADVSKQRPIALTVVGHRCFGEGDAMLTMHARRLAAAAGVDLLTVYLSGSESGARLLGAELWADISSPDIANAILDYLCGESRC
jgi:hypothetical protein